MRALLIALLLTSRVAAQQPVEPATGARPGNQIGTGQSLPLSSKASNATAADTQSVIAPRLPTPSNGDDASAHSYVEAAQRALTLGRTGEAQEALERAETRLLDRSVPRSRAEDASRQPSVAQVTEARRALAAGDRQRSQQLMSALLATLADR